MMHYAARVQVSGLNRQLTLRALLLSRIAVPVIMYFVVSVSLFILSPQVRTDHASKLFFSLLSLAFKAPFSHT